jgi:hypothetical protein
MTGANIPVTLEGDKSLAALYSKQDADDLLLTYSENVDEIEIDALRYAIDTAFEQNEKAVIFLKVVNATDGATLSEAVKALQDGSEGRVRQILALDPANDFDVANIAPLQAVADMLESEHKPTQIIYAPNFVGLLDPFSEDLRALDCKNISVAAGMDGGGKGAELFGVYDKSFSIGGALLGAVSRAKVNECVAWVREFNLNSNPSNEFDKVRLGDGIELVKKSASELDAINAKGFVFLIKHIGKAGSYFNDSHCAIKGNSDFAFIENNRTIDKAVREARLYLLDKLNAPIYVNADGTLTEDTIASFKNDASKALENMQRNKEVSAFAVIIDPAQNVLSTSTVKISLEVVPVGVARNIAVNIGFAVKISN